MKKTYVLDTNVLLGDPNSICSFEDNDIIIPLAVLEELDRHKNRPDDIGRNARHVSRKLDDMRRSGESLLTGVKLPEGGSLRIQPIHKDHIVNMPFEFDDKKVDNLIIAFMQYLAQATTDQHAVLVSQDINVRIKCDSLGIKCEDYRKMRVVSPDTQKFYTGVDVFEVEDAIVDKVYNERYLPLPDLGHKNVYPNQVIIVKSSSENQTKKSAVTRYDEGRGGVVPVMQIKDVFGLQPRNKEQNFSLDLLLDPEIKLLTLVGPSGTGKTLLALAAGLHQLNTVGEVSAYDRIIITRPIQPVGKDIGFLPGTLEEKMEPWIAPIKDNLGFLMGGNAVNSKNTQRKSTGNKTNRGFNEPYLSLMQERGLIEIEAITYIRGRSIPRSFIVIDEAQNLSMHELKTIITRVGEGTKIVLTGDIEQIDNVHVDAFTNGLTYAVERFKEHPIAGHVTLLKGERSLLATLASKIL